ncbi:hypothetical protein NP603_12120 [Methylomonas sp. SURF-1]|uniref:Uncharacterized protein n=1 Tax=Methylomonas aurea TaxID=2952224 RepID=A0ABT1UIA3_9GAMM|nr:hypothetical protein [Methylomonas sp. SURF-1]MCQ8181857.1 hypothetical protein [Methylomonas sp. SURF-1]
MLFIGVALIFSARGKQMAQELVVANQEVVAQQLNTAGLVLGAGLAVASMILVPALAMRLGLSASLTGALRIALMKASSQAARGLK